MDEERNVSLQTLRRMPLYLNYLRSLDNPEGNISARAVAQALDLGEIQVRKDLSAVSGGGKPKVGYAIPALMEDIQRFLGYDDVNDAILVGAGKLGRALMGYAGFGSYGLHIVAAFDTDPGAWGPDPSGATVFPMEKLPNLCPRLGAQIGILTVPAGTAQQACDLMVESGILAVWNFAPAHLSAPEGILIQNENMAASLALLSKHLRDALKK